MGVMSRTGGDGKVNRVAPAVLLLGHQYCSCQRTERQGRIRQDRKQENKIENQIGEMVLRHTGSYRNYK